MGAQFIGGLGQRGSTQPSINDIEAVCALFRQYGESLSFSLD
jgi:hypothetical protein